MSGALKRLGLRRGIAFLMARRLSVPPLAAELPRAISRFKLLRLSDL
ncbi:hypothetical protein GR702_19400 [Novosphingobium sp. FGD1]|jgi:hypothetical protein|uniref:Uncharacterized protein n=1 Tax=Novosphingobium silvae TaxID=2692619 RepID=A0A7X4GLP2_9SPHN|nr:MULTISPECIES: hypothetical protein [Sphingomonadaceae]MYL99929.1 hypothetical protein [Novosphingobium silvae]|tara:strand:+ start:324 stop:464 length:141 start_codon:yes stop_codon:yes gene_type:complete